MFAMNGNNGTGNHGGERPMMSRMNDRKADQNSPDRMSIPYILLTAVVAVLAGVVLAWLG